MSACTTKYHFALLRRLCVPDCHHMYIHVHGKHTCMSIDYKNQNAKEHSKFESSGFRIIYLLILA